MARPKVRRPARRSGTATRNFGVGTRENHDASAFYARFQPKQLSSEEALAPPLVLKEPLVCGDARSMALPDNSVALVVTSPPYFAGKEYEEALGVGTIPATYAEYLQRLSEVFRECRRVLEPGGRIAVNVANLGRRPYRSLAADVTRILDDDLGLLLRGEIIWQKAAGSGGSCAWGSYRSPSNPVLRDVTERVIVASKGRFDRAVSVEQRRLQKRPYQASITTDEFLEATLDLWHLPPESARRVNHPAPFPVELPQRLIELYTWRGDLVLDPFIGSGTTAVAAVRTGRRYAGYDTDEAYIRAARARVAAEQQQPASPPDEVATANGEGKVALALAAEVLADAGFTHLRRNAAVPGLGLQVSLVANDATGQPWYFDVTGAFSSTGGGLRRSDTMWKALGRASVLASRRLRPLVLLSSDLPAPRSAGDRALRSIGPHVVHDVMVLIEATTADRLAAYATGSHRHQPGPGFWTAAEVQAR